YFRYGRWFICMERAVKDANQTAETKETVELTVLGRSHSVFTDLFNTIREDSQDSDKYLCVYTWKDSYWKELCRQYKRDLNTVALPKIDREEILGHVSRFLDGKKWHLN